MMSQSSKLATMPLGFTHNDINRGILKNTKDTRKRENLLTMMSLSSKLATMPLAFTHNDIYKEELRNIKETQKRGKPTYYDAAV